MSEIELHPASQQKVASAASSDHDSSINETATVIPPDPDNQLHTPHPPKTLDNGQRIDAEHPLWDDLCPEDSYVDGVYWADLPSAQRGRWAINQANQEAKRELKVIGGMFKKDPLSPMRAYFSRYVLGGFGVSTFEVLPRPVLTPRSALHRRLHVVLYRKPDTAFQASLAAVLVDISSLR